MSKRILRLIILAAALSLPASGFSNSLVELRGFGSGGALKTNDDHYLPDFDTNGTRVNWASLTRVGINMHAKVSEHLDVNTQFLSRGDTRNFSLQLDWGFLSWIPNQHVSLRVGRLSMPVWLYSQQTDVGYSYLWLSPPVEVYGLNPFKSVSGASLLLRKSVGPGMLQLELMGGSGQQQIYNNKIQQLTEVAVSINDTWAADLTYNVDDRLIARLGYLQGTPDTFVRTPLTLPAGSISGVPVATELTTASHLDLGFSRFVSFGLKGEVEGFVFSSEIARRLIEGTALGTATGYYATLGYRLASWTPHLTWAWQGNLSGTERRHPDYPTNTTLRTGSQSATLGVNYAPIDSVIVKGSLSRSSIRFENEASNIDLYVYGLAVDFVF